jgi:hypothetical protein
LVGDSSHIRGPNDIVVTIHHQALRRRNSGEIYQTKKLLNEFIEAPGESVDYRTKRRFGETPGDDTTGRNEYISILRRHDEKIVCLLSCEDGAPSPSFFSSRGCRSSVEKVKKN